MPGKHPPGYQAAWQRTIRRAATLWRQEHPDEWRTMFDHELSRDNPTPESL